MKKIGIVCLLFFLGLIQISFGQNIPDPPYPPRLVNDYTNTLTADQQDALEQKLVAFDDSTSTQIAVIIVSSLEGNDISDYALNIGRSWGIGGKEYNNGVVFLIAKDDRKMNISTGYGVEGALPDITAKHIIEDEVKPNFKGNDYYRGIDEGTNAIIKAVQGEYYTARENDVDEPWWWVLLFPLIGIVSFVYYIFICIRRLFGGSRVGGSYGDESYGGGSSSGGGFGGFGGGSFGGGGASGGW